MRPGTLLAWILVPYLLASTAWAGEDIYSLVRVDTPAVHERMKLQCLDLDILEASPKDAVLLVRSVDLSVKDYSGSIFNPHPAIHGKDTSGINN